ncbi:fungal-specific transcription factor domain-containing protein [Bisporella sp. PMI_857]|nr:fungal-specific transcription factor domain-containing protein [Bisporella sp. PMI_857]
MSESEEPIRKRRKVSLACAPCRERKIRCSGEKPACDSCQRRSQECSYAVRLESIPGVTESFQSVLDRLQRLENQNRPNNSLAREPNPNQSVDDGPHQQLSYLQAASEYRELPPVNSQHVSEDILRVMSPTCDGSPSIGLEPRTRLSNVRYVGNLSSSLSHVPPLDEAKQVPHKLEEDAASHESLHIVAHEADAMGVSSVCHKNSPQESTQYYGDSSGIAFMRAIRHVLGNGVQGDFVEDTTSSGDRLNLVGFDKSVRSELLKLLPKFEGPRLRPELFALPSRSLSDTLLENYWTRVYPLYPFVHRPTFELAYAMLWNPTGSEALLVQESDAGLGNMTDAGPASQTFYCALNMMLALGSQFLDVSVSERNDIATMFDQRSKNLLVVDMMDRGSIAIIQTLLLSGQFLQSTFYPQRCWNGIGVACRIAQGLGLHVDQSPLQISPLGQEMRRRVWYACMMLDMSASMTMGRPLMIMHKFSTSPPSPMKDENFKSDPRGAAAIGLFLERIKLSEILGIILTTIYDQNISNTNTSAANAKYLQTPIEIDALLEMDKKLTKFQTGLPTELQWAQDGEKLRHSPGPSVGNLEMQSNFLYASVLQSRILLYRTTFIQLCKDAVSKLNEMSSDRCIDSEFNVDNFFVTRGAVSCVTSARELIKLIHRTSQSTISDAWWYNVYYAHTAGMVVVLAQLCNPLKQIVTASYLDQSWALCHETLSKMSSYGQVPQRCLESLEVIRQKISRLGLSNPKMKSREPRQDNVQSREPELLKLQEVIASNSPGLTHISHGQGGIQSQTAEDSADPEGSMCNMSPSSRTPVATDNDDKNNFHWSANLTDLWTFPGGDFGFDDLNFMQ